MGVAYARARLVTYNSTKYKLLTIYFLKSLFNFAPSISLFVFFENIFLNLFRWPLDTHHKNECFTPIKEFKIFNLL